VPTWRSSVATSSRMPEPQASPTPQESCTALAKCSARVAAEPAPLIDFTTATATCVRAHKSHVTRQAAHFAHQRSCMQAHPTRRQPRATPTRLVAASSRRACRAARCARICAICAALSAALWRRSAVDGRQLRLQRVRAGARQQPVGVAQKRAVDVMPPTSRRLRHRVGNSRNLPAVAAGGAARQRAAEREHQRQRRACARHRGGARRATEGARSK
jgi:hypothetical protein